MLDLAYLFEQGMLSSGYNEQEALRRYAGKALACFVQKPYRPEVLMVALNTAISAATK